MGKEDEIKIIAYRIWEEEGYRHGHDVEHWFKAEIIWETEHPVEKERKVDERAAAPKITEPNSIKANKTPKKEKPPVKKG